MRDSVMGGQGTRQGRGHKGAHPPTHLGLKHKGAHPPTHLGLKLVTSSCMYSSICPRRTCKPTHPAQHVAFTVEHVHYCTGVGRQTWVKRGTV